jgi:nicotinamidase-related amidase
MQTEHCVAHTSRGALAGGLEVTVLKGAHSTYDEPKPGRTAEELERSVEGELLKDGATVVAWEDFLNTI